MKLLRLRVNYYGHEEDEAGTGFLFIALPEAPENNKDYPLRGTQLWVKSVANGVTYVARLEAFEEASDEAG